MEEKRRRMQAARAEVEAKGFSEVKNKKYKSAEIQSPALPVEIKFSKKEKVGEETAATRVIHDTSPQFG